MSRTAEVWLPRSRPDFAGFVLLDTHVWLWYLDGVTERMSADAVELLRRAAGGAGLRVSDISVWEVGNKAAKGKLTLIPSVPAWIERAAQVPGFSFVPLARDILLFSTQLPGVVHGDPADRMLIASAALEGVPLVTADRLILAYAEESHLFSACDVRPYPGSGIVASISVVIPTLNGGAAFVPLCRHLALVRERFGLEVLIIDSGSSDGTPEVAERAGFRVHRIPPAEFGHARTRNLAVRMTTGEIVCFLTQDVLPCTPDWPLRFAEALADPSVAGVYGRQVPRDASTMEMFFVSLNYPPEPLRFDPQPGGHHPRPGRVLFSNAFSAVRRELALRVPFGDEVPVSEDQMWAHQVLDAGYSVVYEPRAEALHAHRYSLRGLFRRTYRVGVALRAIGLDRGASLPESLSFLRDEVRYFVRQGHTHRLPQLLAYEFIRWAGFQAGRRSG